MLINMRSSESLLVKTSNSNVITYYASVENNRQWEKLMNSYYMIHSYLVYPLNEQRSL